MRNTDLGISDYQEMLLYEIPVNIQKVRDAFKGEEKVTYMELLNNIKQNKPKKSYADVWNLLDENETLKKKNEEIIKKRDDYLFQLETDKFYSNEQLEIEKKKKVYIVDKLNEMILDEPKRITEEKCKNAYRMYNVFINKFRSIIIQRVPKDDQQKYVDLIPKFEVFVNNLEEIGDEYFNMFTQNIQEILSTLPEKKDPSSSTC
ncbi:hypothetical protein TRFO_27793 [Tritrichomonas foetus]|uniref:Uncharacterized protein n=1 Tax=Tritrichomonas foetus TaxID=1144522 RepID=A0A1J4K116_9EUKA|nr:hypothetical protein TRFO_27793 [Tritrichomonas foetus]|eukprot:OHT04650.1 hypothetical protein TRFO_27793 [Tritrichomonas foetus]